MPLNPEEKMQQAKYEKRNPYARLTPDQIKIGKLERNVNKQEAQLKRIKHHMFLYDSHERSAGVTLDAIRAVLR